jgi:hypothetical protein
MKKLIKSLNIVLLSTALPFHAAAAEVKSPDNAKPNATKIEQQQIQRVTQTWLKAWNRHAIDDILSHYADDVELTSPFVAKLFKQASGTITGKKNLRIYFQKGLTTYPKVKFKWLATLNGADSVMLIYRAVNNVLVAETMYFNDDGKIVKVIAHYSK